MIGHDRPYFGVTKVGTEVTHGVPVTRLGCQNLRALMGFFCMVFPMFVGGCVLEWALKKEEPLLVVCYWLYRRMAVKRLEGWSAQHKWMTRALGLMSQCNKYRPTLWDIHLQIFEDPQKKSPKIPQKSPTIPQKIPRNRDVKQIPKKGEHILTTPSLTPRT